MVIRFPVRFVAVATGFIFCVLSVFYHPHVMTMMSNAQELPMQRILVIDPGHGGKDGGAVGADGQKESEINLEISLKLNSMCHLYGISTVMTRNTEEIKYPDEAKSISEMKKADQKMRLTLIQDYPDAILYSIHQNFYPSELPSGVQVLYGHNQASRELGILLHENLNRELSPNSHRAAMEIDDNIYLLKHCKCTAVLIECGFLSNPTEAQLLKDTRYQSRVAAIMLSSYFQYIN